MVVKKKNPLKDLLLAATQSSPEEQQNREELQKCLEEREKRERNRIKEEIRLREAERQRLIKEGKITIVESLFTTRFMFFDKRLYLPKVEELLAFLQDKHNAIEFWQDPHVKMIYNVSDYFSFLLSIYSDETDDEEYESWLRWNFSNPFASGLIENYDRVADHRRLRNASDVIHKFNTLKNLFRMKFNEETKEGRINGNIITTEVISGSLKELERSKFIISMSLNDTLTEENTYKPLSELEYDDVCFINPFNKNEVYFVNPLYVMDNNFLRLDTYYAWRDRIQAAWGEVREAEPKMFEILDALVTSRKIYIKEMYK